MLPRASSPSDLQHPTFPLLPSSSSSLFHPGQAQPDFMPSSPTLGQGKPAGDQCGWQGKSHSVSVPFEQFWELLEGLVSVGELGWGGRHGDGGWWHAGEELYRFQRDDVWRKGFFLLHPKKSLHLGPTSVTAWCLDSFWGALHQ